MKKYLIMLAMGSLMACSNGNGNERGQEVQSDELVATEPAQSEVKMEGRQLIKGSDCSACHMDDAKIIGPSYKEVAEKYEANQENISYLATKIIEGGSGNWGEVPMTPHPQFSQEEAESMAKYILSLN